MGLCSWFFFLSNFVIGEEKVLISVLILYPVTLLKYIFQILESSSSFRVF
jgi:hypothetical protein